MSDQFFGIYRGIVIDRNDPEGLYRLRVKVPQVSGGNSTGWASACLPVTYFEEPKDHTHTAHSHGFIDPSSGSPGVTSADVVAPHEKHVHETPRKTTYPMVGSAVWIMYEGGNPRYPVWVGVA